MDEQRDPGDGTLREDDAHTRPGSSARWYTSDDTTYAYLTADEEPPLVYEPAVVYEPPPPKEPRGDRSLVRDLGMVVFVVAAIVLGLVTWNIVGDFTASALVRVKPSPTAVAVATARPIPAASPSAVPSAAPPAAPTPEPKPVRKPVNVRIEPKPKAMFVSEQTKTRCASAAIQITLNVNGPKVNTTAAYQAKINQLAVAATDRTDSRNGGVGPDAMAAVLNDLGPVNYELRTYKTREAALLDAARAISATGDAVILLAWRGAHAWVMTGYRADADPLEFKNAKVTGTYILDPWYPRVSSIWGRSDPPGTFQNAAEMRRNYLPWKRPEGKYPGRDGKFLALVPADAP